MLMRFDPFQELSRIADRLAPGAGSSFLAMDAVRHGDVLRIHFDLPGVAPEDIDVSVDQGELTLSAQRRGLQPDAGEILADERPAGTFTRRLTLGEALDFERLDAAYSDGVLTLTIPAAESAKPRRIEVTAHRPAELTSA